MILVMVQCLCPSDIFGDDDELGLDFEMMKKIFLSMMKK